LTPAALQDGVTIQGFEVFPSFVLVSDVVPVRAIVTRGGVSRDCTNSARWRSNPPIAHYTGFPARGIYGDRVGTTEVTAECDGMTGSQPVTFDRYEIVGTVVDDEGRLVTGFHMINPYDFEGQYEVDPGQFIIGRVTKRRVPLTFYKAGYQSQTYDVEWDLTPTTKPTVKLLRLGMPIIDEEIRIGGNDYTFELPTPGLVRVETEFFSASSAGGGSMISELFAGSQLLATNTFRYDSALPRLKRPIETRVGAGTYWLRFRNIYQFERARISVTHIETGQRVDF